MKRTYSLFPKMFQGESAESLAAILHETEIGCVDLLIRDGFWVSPAKLKEEAPAFVRYMRQQGIQVNFATTSYMPDALLNDPTPLAVMSELGIEGFRIGYFPYDPSVSIRRQLADWHAKMSKLSELCARYKVKAIYQVHHSRTQLIQHSFTALSIVEDLPPEYVGIMLDPGNQFHEGREHYGKAAALLGRYLAAVGVKDIAVRQDSANRDKPNKGWVTEWAPCQDGLINWHEISDNLSALTDPIVINLQMHYDHPDRRKLLDTLKIEWAYIESVFK
ncbi:MAG: xylose isomerase [Paenibacillus sp.]|nr:xylose isomerase [Paenibacillus sp.]